MEDVKVRAGRNRTLTVASEEESHYRSMIATIDTVNDEGVSDNQIINADLFDVIDKISDQSVDLMIIDPPYNLDKDFHGGKFKAMSDSDYEEYLRSWFDKVCNKLKPDGTLYMCGDWKCSSAQQKVISGRLTILNRITWQREKGRGAKNNWKNAMEDIWFAVKDKSNYFYNVEAVKMKRQVIAPYKVDGKPKDWTESDDGNFRITFPSNFWDDISIPFWSMPENTDHPTQKPEKLIAKLILASSKPGDMVFDPFMGSGTTCVTAKKLGRKYIGIEINETYCLWAAKRLEMADKDTTIQGYTGGYFWERNTLNKQQASETSKQKKAKANQQNAELSLFSQVS